MGLHQDFEGHSCIKWTNILLGFIADKRKWVKNVHDYWLLLILIIDYLTNLQVFLFFISSKFAKNLDFWFHFSHSSNQSSYHLHYSLSLGVSDLIYLFFACKGKIIKKVKRNFFNPKLKRKRSDRERAPFTFSSRW